MDGSRQQQQQLQIQQILQQALASTTVPSSISQPASNQILAHLAPLSAAAPVVCASPLSLALPLPASNTAVVPSLIPPLGRIVYTQPTSLTGTTGGFAVIAPSGGGFAALQVIGSGRPLGGSGGMVVLPSAGGTTYLPGQLRGPSVATLSSTAVSPVIQPFVLRPGSVATIPSTTVDSSNLNAVRPPVVGPISPRTSGSATVHHLGSGDQTKESPFVHLRGHFQSVKMQDNSSKLQGGVEGRNLVTESADAEKPPAKRIKLETPDDITGDITSAKYYRKLYIESHERDMAEIRATYQEHITELFFLENGGNLMDFIVWSKRPNVHLNRLLQAENLDADYEFSSPGEEEKHINNEVKVLTTIGSTIPIVTPVAIATTLPPAITALQQEFASGLMSPRKAGGRHGMVFGYVPPKVNQFLPLVPGGVPLSPKAATTTVGSPPPYMLACSVTQPTSSTLCVEQQVSSSAAFNSPQEDLASILSAPKMTDGVSVHVAVGGGESEDNSSSTTAVYPAALPTASGTLVGANLPGADISVNSSCSEVAALSASHEAVADQAKQEAQVLQRIADLRRQGMWSARRLPKVQEPPRWKSHWDYVLDEMQWLAVDFSQERRWKMAAAKMLAHDSVKYHAVLEEKRKQEGAKVAGRVASMIRDFWKHMTEIAYYKHHQMVEEEHSGLVDYIQKNFDDYAHDLHFAESESDHCYSTKNEIQEKSDAHIQDELADLIKEGEMPLEDLVEKYAAAYDVDVIVPSSPESILSTDSSSDESKSCFTPSSGGDNRGMEIEQQSNSSVNLIDLASTLQSLQPTGTKLQMCPVNFEPPLLLKQRLRDYQHIGVDWLTVMHQTGIGCILADAGGLGKKVQTVSFLAHLEVNLGQWGPHLIVAPVCHLLKWKTEFDRWFPSCRTFLYYGDAFKRKSLRKFCQAAEADNHVFIMSYQILVEDLNYFERNKWKCIVLDAIDTLADFDETLPAVMSLTTEYSMLLARKDITQLQQMSLCSLVTILFQKDVRQSVREQLECYSLSDLKQLVSLLSLKRTVDDVCDQIPTISTEMINCSLTPKQEAVYREIVTKNSDVLSGDHRMTKVLSTIVELQRIINHPLLNQSSIMIPVTSSFVLDPVLYTLPFAVQNVVIHDLWMKVQLSLFEQIRATECPRPSADTLGQESKTDLFVELEQIMCATKSVESGAVIADSTVVQVTALMQPGLFYQVVYPSDALSSIKQKLSEVPAAYDDSRSSISKWRSRGFSLCRSVVWDVACSDTQTGDCLKEALQIPLTYLEELRSVFNRLLCTMPAVLASVVFLGALESSQNLDSLSERLCCSTNNNSILPPLPSGSGVGIKLNELPLLSCSGKLRTLLNLLHRLTSESRRAVIMSHMSGMLDVLELFMDIHHFCYCRIDASVKVEQRRTNILKFNVDRRVPFLLVSSRVPLIGLPIPDVDVVIMYDFDMRSIVYNNCERFCQQLAGSKDVLIYRLQTIATIEDNLMNLCSKRILDGIESCGAEPELALFSQDAICDIFSGTLFTTQRSPSIQRIVSGEGSDDSERQALCDLLDLNLNVVEASNDCKAALSLLAEKRLVMDDLTGHLNLDKVENRSWRQRKRKLSSDSLPEIEHYAVDCIYHQLNPPYDDDDVIQEQDSKPIHDRWLFESSKMSNDDQASECDAEADIPLTYDYEADQLFIDDVYGDTMPVWAPPTPPQDDRDMYIDQTQTFIYEQTPMTESQLPPVYVRKGHKRHRMNSLNRKHKMRIRDELPSVPRSLFDCPQTLAQRVERDMRLQKQQGMMKPGLKIQLQQQQQMIAAAVNNAAGMGLVGRPLSEQTVQESPEWLVHEDWALLQALQTLQEMPLNLLTHSPGHVPNWDLIADIVNCHSRTYRSAKLCKQRYENFILPREEGRLTYDTSPRKLKKATKGLYKSKYNRSMRTNQLYMQDGGKAWTTLFTLRFDAIKNIAANRTPAVRPQPTGAIAAGLKNTKHIAVLAESGINYDHPLSPGQVAAMRAERIAKEVKEKKMASAASSLSQVDVQQAAQQLSQPAPRPPLTAPTSTLQQLIIQPPQGATGHVILQSGQQLISAATGQHVLASVDGRPQQMTIVQGAAGSAAGQVASGGAIPAASLLSAGLVKSSTAPVAAATGTSVARSLSIPGIIVSQTIAGQTIATINKGQTVVAPASFLQAQGQQVRGTMRNVAPFASGVSIVSQNASGVLGEATIARVISTTSPLTPAQLVVTNQKQGIVGMSSLVPGAVPQQLLGISVATSVGSLAAAVASKGLAPTQQVQVMRHKQVLPHFRPTTVQVPQQATTVSGNVAAVVAGQKAVTVSTPVVASIAQGLRPAAIQELLKRTQQQQQQQVAKTVTGTVAVQPVQVSKTQLLESMHIQQIPSSGAMFMKAVSSTVGGTVVSTVTLPTAPGANNTLSLFPQQKLVAGKLQPAQLRQLPMQKRPTAAVQIQGTQKVAGAALQQMKIQSPMIFRPQQVVVQQVTTQQLAKSTQQGLSAPRIQQFIPSGQTSTPTAVLASQMLAQPGSSAALTAVAKTLSVTITTATLPSAAGVTISAPVATIAGSVPSAIAPMTATVKLLPTSVTTLVKQVKDPTAVASPSASTLAVASRSAAGTPAVVGLQQVLIRPGANVTVSMPAVSTGTVGTLPHVTLSAVSAAARAPGVVGAVNTVSVTASTPSSAAAAAATPSVIPVSPGVQQAVQEVVQQAQAQARQQPITAINFVAISSAATATVQSPGGQSPSVTIIGTNLAAAGSSQQGTVDPGTPGSKSSSSSSSSPYVMRLRNQKS